MTGRSTIDTSSVLTALRRKMNVMNAVMLRDMRTRFFNHGLGFLVVSLWPLVHMGVLLVVYQLSGRTAPYGDSMNVFFATGLIPTLAFMYISRFMSLSIVLNKPMLGFPVVTILDILFGRALLEIIAAVLTLEIMMLVLYIAGDNPFPHDPEQAALAYLSAILLAVGVGILAGVVAMVTEVFVTIYALLMIIVYVSSGTLFVGSNLPEPLGTALSWNPIFQSVEWMRTAYFETYSSRLLDRGYLVMFGACCLCLGLFLERVFRRRIKEG